MPYWDFSGSTMVTGNYIRLTPDIQSRSGSLWNTQPVMAQNWEVNVNFKVSGKGKDLYGDGLAIWYAKERLVPGAVFGSKDNFFGLAIILDTYSNHNGPHNVSISMRSLSGVQILMHFVFFCFSYLIFAASTSIYQCHGKQWNAHL